LIVAGRAITLTENSRLLQAGEELVNHSLRRTQILVSILLLNLGMFSGGVFAQKQKPPETTEDGLNLVKVKGIDIAYVRPGASLAGYKRVMVDPTQVEFDKNWDPEKTGSRMKLSAKDRESIRTELAELFNKTFKQELEKKNGYPVVTEAAPDVLRVSAALSDVYGNAPDTMEPGRSRTYVMNAGRATLIAELRDSETGQILARVADRGEARDTGLMQISNSAWNSAEAQALISNWARILRKRMDAVRTEKADAP
jgi:hypothetical protein